MPGKWDVYRRLLGYLRPHWREVMVAYVSMLIATVLSLLVPQLVKRAIDSGLSTGNARALFVTGGLILLVAIARGIVSLVQRF
jgi:ABC-type multidrug transport system fused ATPase/permease subunit